MVTGFLAKSDGRDKLLATVQYACMFIAAGSAGVATKIQKSVAQARKAFRILRPLDALAPLLQSGLAVSGPPPIVVAKNLRPVFMASYFLFDHVGWAAGAGLVTDKKTIEKCQKISTYSWLLGSLSTVTIELHALTRPVPSVETSAEKEARRATDRATLLRLVHALVQAGLAAGLLGIGGAWPARRTAALGVAASAINCYMLLPPRPAKTSGVVVQGGSSTRGSSSESAGGKKNQ